MMLLEDGTELRGDALRQEDRDAGANADELDVRNRAEAPQQRVELLIGEKEWISAREQDVAHLGVLLEVGDRLVEIRMEFLLPRPTHHAGARAVAAVGGAPIGDQEEDTVGVAVNQSGHRHMAILPAGVSHLRRRNSPLADMGDNLTADRACGIVPLD